MLYQRFYGERLPLGTKQVYRAGTKRRRKQGIRENRSAEKGLKEKSAEFVEKGTEVYAKT